MPGVKQRALPGFRIPLSQSYATVRRSPSGVPIPVTSMPKGTLADKHLEGLQTTTSENHPDWVTLKRAMLKHQPSPVPQGRDWGGDFTSLKMWVETPNYGWFHTKSKPVFSSSDGVNVTVEREFPLYIPLTYNSALFPPYGKSSDALLSQVGATAISRCLPTNPVASLGVATLEGYKDGLPHLVGHTLWQDKTSLARSAGEEYLNSEFGWQPLISDVKDFANGVANMGRLQQQFIRDSGKDVHRRYTFPLSQTVSSSTVSQGRTVGGPFDGVSGRDQQSGALPSVITRDRRITVEQWFSGVFTYHAPDYFGDVIEHANLAVELLGLDLSPELLWNLAPWSWAADWFSNTGDVIHNLDNYSKYGLVLKRGYIMEHTLVRDTYSMSGVLNAGFDPQYTVCTGYPPSFVICSETKLRRHATPFGFGVSFGSLQPTQLAIMAALGLVFLA